MKSRNKTTLLTVGLIVGIIIGLLILFSFVTKRSANKVNLNYATQQTNKDSLYGGIGSNVANVIKHSLASLKEEVVNLKKENKEEKIKDSTKQQGSTESFQAKKLLNDKFQQITQKIDDIQTDVTQKLKNITNTKNSIPVGKGDDKVAPKNEVVWIKDEAVELKEQEEADNKNKGLFGKASSIASIHKKEDDKKPLPAFSIPDATILTGVTTMTNLVGRIPRGDEHNVFAPYETLFHVDVDNLTSKNYRLPKELTDLTGRALCVGDFMSSSVSCKVISITYIFKDGTISTDKPKGAVSGTNFNGLGYFTDQNGRTQIDGKLVTSIGIRVGSTALAGIVSGIGAGVSQSGLAAPAAGGLTPFQAITNIGAFAGGQAINQGGQAASKEFQDFSKNLFDYVVADNWDAQTKSLKKFNIVITQEIDIDYDKHGRKLDHHLVTSSTQNNTHIIF
jgi:integrating conjugative element protein (TIGR03752 family)